MVAAMTDSEQQSLTSYADQAAGRSCGRRKLAISATVGTRG